MTDTPIHPDTTALTPLERIKLIALTAGGAGEIDTHSALSRIVRICLDAGVTANLTELRGRADVE